MFYVCLILICGGAVALDQTVKALVVANIPLGGAVEIIPGLIRLTYVRNTGAAFSILSGQRTFFLILTAVFLAGVVWCVVKKKLPRPYLWILAVITGGAIGNFIDRISTGLVIDMICIPWFSTFNVADLFITFGALILVVYIFVKDKELLADKPKAQPEENRHDPDA